MRLVALLIGCAISVYASAAITFVDENSAESLSSTQVTVTDPTGATSSDFYVADCTNFVGSGTWTIPSGWTELWESASGAINVSYIERGGSAPDLTWDHSQTGDMRCTVHAYRDVDDSSPFDVTFSSGSHVNDNTNDACATAPPAITTVTDGAWVQIFQWCRGDSDITFGAPTNYTQRAFYEGDNNTLHNSVDREITSAGTETPGAWNHSDVVAGADATNVTIALRPASDSAAAARRRH